MGAGQLVFHTVAEIQQAPEGQLAGRVAASQPRGVAGGALPIAADAPGLFQTAQQVIDRGLPPGKPEMQLADQQGLIVVDQI